LSKLISRLSLSIDQDWHLRKAKVRILNCFAFVSCYFEILLLFEFIEILFLASELSLLLPMQLFRRNLRSRTNFILRKKTSNKKHCSNYWLLCPYSFVTNTFTILIIHSELHFRTFTTHSWQWSWALYGDHNQAPNFQSHSSDFCDRLVET